MGGQTHNGREDVAPQTMGGRTHTGREDDGNGKDGGSQGQLLALGFVRLQCFRSFKLPQRDYGLSVAPKGSEVF